MAQLKRVVLDVLKPHQPNPLEFATAIAELGDDCCVKVTVIEVDEKTQTVVLEIAGEDLQFNAIEAAIAKLGASLHSIDEVEVTSHSTVV